MDDAYPPDEDLDVSEPLYQKCEHCRAMRDRVAGPCPSCNGTGYWPVGLTVGQVDRLVERERALKGDPGIPRERRRAVLEAVQREAAAAMVVLRSEEGKADG